MTQCKCELCNRRKILGLRPISIFSPNHKSMRVLVFDTETTGLPKRNASITDSDAWPHIVQWSWLVFDVKEERIVSTSDYIIKLPGNLKIPEESTKIHGINNNMMRTKGRLFKQVLTEFISDYEMCDYLVAHNLEFDKKMVQVECFRHHLPVNYAWNKSVQNFCTMKRTKSLCDMKGTLKYGKNAGNQYVRYPKLSELHQTLFNYSDLKNLHNSMMDVIICFRCFCVFVFEKDPFEYKIVVQQLSKEIAELYGTPYLRMLNKLIA